MRARIIINPIAGGRGARPQPPARVEMARRLLGQYRADGEAMLTDCAGHAETLARQAAAEHYDLVFAWGGDGTVNEVARGLAFTETAMAVVPAGSGNGLARALCIPRDPAAALARGFEQPARRIDGGSLGGRFFVNVGGIGLDADVAWRFNRRTRGRRGSMAYVPIAIRSGLLYRAADYRLTLDGETLRERALIIAIANFPEYGNGAIVAPGALPDDGLLDVIVVRERSVAGRLRGAYRLLDGTLLETPGVLHRRVRRVVIETEQAIRFHTDGDPHEADSVLVGIVHARALNVRA